MMATIITLAGNKVMVVVTTDTVYTVFNGTIYFKQMYITLDQKLSAIEGAKATAFDLCECMSKIEYNEALTDENIIKKYEHTTD